MTPYYEDEDVTLYHGDCLELTTWLDADVLVTDPPYGIGWHQDLSGYRARGYVRGDIDHPGIANDEDTAARDEVLALWGDRPALVFGSPRLAPPVGTKHVLTWRKPLDAGLIGSWLPWRRDTESIFVLGKWPMTRGAKASSVIEGPRGMRSYLPTGQDRHPHTKPQSVMTQLIDRTPDGVIADPFAGGGATLMAARNLGRKAIGIEIEERYCEFIAERLSQGVLL